MAKRVLKDDKFLKMAYSEGRAIGKRFAWTSPCERNEQKFLEPLLSSKRGSWTPQPERGRSKKEGGGSKKEGGGFKKEGASPKKKGKNIIIQQ